MASCENKSTCNDYLNINDFYDRPETIKNLLVFAQIECRSSETALATKISIGWFVSVIGVCMIAFFMVYLNRTYNYHKSIS